MGKAQRAHPPPPRCSPTCGPWRRGRWARRASFDKLRSAPLATQSARYDSNLESALLVELDRCLAEEHEIRRRDRNGPVDAEDRNLELVPGLDGIRQHHAVRNVEPLDGRRTGD